MNDSHFETSGIRKMIIKITGIDVTAIDHYAADMLSKNESHPIIIHFTCRAYPNRACKTAMLQVEFDRLCESNLTEFKAYFEKIARNANEAQML